MKAKLALAIILMASLLISCSAVEGAVTTIPKTPSPEGQSFQIEGELPSGCLEAVFTADVLIWINGSIYGVKRSDTYTYVPIPMQDVSPLFEWVTIEGDDGFWSFDGTTDDIIWEFPVENLPHSQHIGVLVNVDPTKAKPATVIRKYLGITYNVQCLVSQTVVDMWVADTLNIGDYVVVSFIDEIPDTEEVNLAIVVDKVYDSWS